jgi:hypothetical protein
MHLRIDKLSRHARTLTDTDPTWILDEGWLQQHGQSVLQNSWRAAVLACLPSQALGKDYDQASLVYGTIIIRSGLTTNNVFKGRCVFERVSVFLKGWMLWNCSLMGIVWYTSDA